MDISAIAGVSTAPGPSRVEGAQGSATFGVALASQQQVDAARGVLAALPAPIVYSLRDQAGSPAETVDRLFNVVKDGSFVPPDGPLGQPGSIIGATAHAVSL